MLALETASPNPLSVDPKGFISLMFDMFLFLIGLLSCPVEVVMSDNLTIKFLSYPVVPTLGVFATDSLLGSLGVLAV